MSDWGLFEIEDVWNDYGKPNDHIVPDPRGREKSSCMVNTEYRKGRCGDFTAVSEGIDRSPTTRENASERKQAAMECSSKKEENFELLDVDPWDSLEDDSKTDTLEPKRLSETEVKLQNSEDGDCSKDVKLDSSECENDLISLGISKDDPILANEEPILGDKNAVIDNNNTCHFSLADIYTAESELEFFGNASDDKIQYSLLDCVWPNIGSFEDVDRLFRNCETAFGSVTNNNVDEILWPSFSGSADISEGSSPHGQSSLDLDSKVLKGKLEDDGQKMDFMPCDSAALASFHVDNPKAETDNINTCSETNFRPESSLDFQESRNKVLGHTNSPLNDQQYGEKRKISALESYQLEPEKQSEKCNQSKRQPAGQKQAEEKRKKQLPDTKAVPCISTSGSHSTGYAVQHCKSPGFQNSAASALQIFPSPAPSLQKQMEVTSLRHPYHQVPYIHTGYGYPVHYVPFMPSLPAYPSHVGQAQPVFPAYRSSPDTRNQQKILMSQAENPLRPPIMTPQEKIEKLRWRQQMQARLAIEHQQQRLGANNDLMDASNVNVQLQKAQTSSSVNASEGRNKALPSSSADSEAQVLQQNSPTASAATSLDSGDFMEGSILHQLQNVISQLEMKTRICIRDALYRLARSAMQRRCLGNTEHCNQNGKDLGTSGMCACMSADKTQPSRYEPDEMETQTNPIDRSIAYLLFNKCSIPADSNIIPESSNDPQLSFTGQQQNLWLNSSSENSMITATRVQRSPLAQSPTVHNPTNIKDSSSGASCSSSSAYYNPQLASEQLHKNLHQLEKKSSDFSADASQSDTNEGTGTLANSEHLEIMGNNDMTRVSLKSEFRLTKKHKAG